MPGPRWAAHRGGAALWPENSLLAFREALRLGAPLVELDVHLARDGGVAVIHDRTLERTTDGAGPIAERTSAELRRLRLRDRGGALTGERLPMLDDVLALLAPSPASLLLEVKGPGPAVGYERRAAGLHPIAGPRYDGLEARALAVLDAHGMRSRATVLAFNPDVVAAVRTAAPSMRTALLLGRSHVERAAASIDELLGVATGLGVTDVGLEHTLVDGRVVASVRRRGLALGVWTVDDPALMRRYADLGVEILTTDRPDLAAQVFAA